MINLFESMNNLSKLDKYVINNDLKLFQLLANDIKNLNITQSP